MLGPSGARGGQLQRAKGASSSNARNRTLPPAFGAILDKKTLTLQVTLSEHSDTPKLGAPTPCAELGWSAWAQPAPTTWPAPRSPLGCRPAPLDAFGKGECAHTTPAAVRTAPLNASCVTARLLPTPPTSVTAPTPANTPHQRPGGRCCATGGGSHGDCAAVGSPLLRLLRPLAAAMAHPYSCAARRRCRCCLSNTPVCSPAWSSSPPCAQPFTPPGRRLWTTRTSSWAAACAPSAGCVSGWCGEDVRGTTAAAELSDRHSTHTMPELSTMTLTTITAQREQREAAQHRKVQTAPQPSSCCGAGMTAVCARTAVRTTADCCARAHNVCGWFDHNGGCSTAASWHCR
jgi:hypothetical protein